MPKVIVNALSPPTVRHAPPGRHADGGGLFLLVKQTGRRSWVYRYKLGGRERDIGLGPAAGSGAVGLADARAAAADLRRKVKAGIDPLDERVLLESQAQAASQEAEIRAMTFKSVAETYIGSHEPSWRNAKHRAQWRTTLETYAYPFMGDLPVADVGTSHVMAALEPIWSKKPETASRVRGRIESVLDYAKSREWRSGENPARWRGHIANLLPKRTKVAKVEHHAALPWAEIGTFMAALREREATAANALEFLILTAARTGEVVGARWSEIDAKRKIWTVPPDRMKAGREHRVPLSTVAAGIVDRMKPLRKSESEDGYIFPGGKAKLPLSQMAMLMLLRRMERPNITVHGFRSTFRDWCAEATGFPYEMAEIALAHTVGDKVEAAYRRGDMIEKRRRMMDDWAKFCAKSAGEAANVTPIRRGKFA
jgi:integrase